jgi:hypothetical protein
MRARARTEAGGSGHPATPGAQAMKASIPALGRLPVSVYATAEISSWDLRPAQCFKRVRCAGCDRDGTNNCNVRNVSSERALTANLETHRGEPLAHPGNQLTTPCEMRDE